MNIGKTLLVYCEVKGQRTLTALSKELLGCGRHLAAKLGCSISAVLLGREIRECAAEAMALGADVVYVADDERLASWQPEQQVQLLESITERANAGIVLFGHTDRGRDLAPRLAFRKQTIAYMDCVSVEVVDDASCMQYVRPIHGGSIHAVYRSSGLPQIATLRKGVASAPLAEAGRLGHIEDVPVSRATEVATTRTIRRETEGDSGVRLEDAPVVLCGGRGIGGAEGFTQLRELAGLLKGAVGATRPPCDDGWVSSVVQIGLTGKIVSPKLYLAVGVSGASQHITGCSKARTIVAINKDPEANIFKIAHIGVVGDWRKIFPSFGQRVKELLGG